ncbi:hypothetical protein ABW21_db0208996 [Orbilia brochopaga]|nr:hypothetical protein ABW21_db0208996 [Drechslerella brochopaga]
MGHEPVRVFGFDGVEPLDAIEMRGDNGVVKDTADIDLVLETRLDRTTRPVFRGKIIHRFSKCEASAVFKILGARMGLGAGICGGEGAGLETGADVAGQAKEADKKPVPDLMYWLRKCTGDIQQLKHEIARYG